jgi:superfamily II DNA or RNA helicase
MKQYTEVYNPKRVIPNKKQIQDYQKFAKNFLSVDSGNDSLFLWHSTGRGKTLTSLAISEEYSKMLTQTAIEDGYIYIIGSNASIENFINELTNETGNLINNLELNEDNIYITNEEKVILENELKKYGETNTSLYNILYKKFILSRLETAKYRFYTYQKFINLNIKNIDNSLIIIDEAHNLLNTNEYSLMLQNLTKNSKNYKLLLLSATPMFNSPYDIVDFLNLMLKEKEKLKFADIFEKNAEETDDFIKEGGIEILKKKAKNKISFVTVQYDDNFPKEINIGEIPHYLKETYLIEVPMSKEQMEQYSKYWNGILTQEIKYIINAVVDKKFVNLENVDQYKLKLDQLHKYAPKYAKCLENVFEDHKKGKSMIYHSYVNNSGIKLVEEIFKNNGFLKYNESYIHPNARDRKTGKLYSEFKNNKEEFSPVRYGIIYGDINNTERELIVKTFNSHDNLFGEKLSVLLGSQLLRESVDLKGILAIHILNYQENYSRIYQILGRGIRYKSHYGLPKDLWYTKIYKYCSSIPDSSELSAEQLEYFKDEKNYIKMKKITNILKLISVDCELNLKYNFDKKNPYKCETKIADLSTLPRNLYDPFYYIFYSENDIDDAITYIINLFNVETIIDYKGMLKLVPYEKDIVNEALNKIVESKIKVSNKDGYIIKIGENYLFQPYGYDSFDIDVNLRMQEKIEEKTDITEICRDIGIEIEKKYKFNIEKIYDEIRESPENIDLLLYKYEKKEQVEILEDALKKYIKAKKTIPEEVYLILKLFKRYLIDESEVEKNLMSSAFDKYFDSITWNIKDENRNFVGHFLETTLRIYNKEKDQFESVLKNYFVKEKKRELKDNPYSVGFLDRDQS